MVRDQLSNSMIKWAQKTVFMDEAVLESPWDWQGYSEGIRFVFFRIIEELRAMAVDEVCSQPYQNNHPSRAIQQLLLNYHTAYWDLKSLCLGIPEEVACTAPAENEWSLKKVLQHTIDAEWAFFGIFQYAYRYAGTREDWKKEKIPNSFFDQHFSEEYLYSEKDFEGNLSELLGLYEKLHRLIMMELSGMHDGHLQDELNYWEPQPMLARFRLIRFETHLRQHTIHAEKTLAALGYQRSGEVRQLINLCLQAYADLDAILLFNPELDQGKLEKYWNEKVHPYLEVILGVLPPE
jgi:hypothetical protein